ncbi:MAG: PIN domain-containing protein [Chloroflexota bacterium]|nr:PIN domain-containing protein [Chloroflexota bacterium]
MTVLDASALLGALHDEPGRPVVENLLRGKPPPSISALNLAEVAFKLQRQGGWEAVEVRDRIDWLIVGGLQVEPLWLVAARRAAAIRATHYRREAAPLSLADCVCLATAIQLGTDVATTDPGLATVARALGIAVLAVPDSNGVRP